MFNSMKVITNSLVIVRVFRLKAGFLMYCVVFLIYFRTQNVCLRFQIFINVFVILFSFLLKKSIFMNAVEQVNMKERIIPFSCKRELYPFPVSNPIKLFFFAIKEFLCFLLLS